MNADSVGSVGLGATLSAQALSDLLERVLRSNEHRSVEGRPAVPTCVWGPHGVGKTALIEALAEKMAWRFAYAAPAQFEEMGDLHGLPMIKNGATVFAAPDWVPTEPGPGILLLDDLNRADDRILRGLMQLLQRSELVSWALPEGWQIIATANPEGADYSVTPMDDAMLTRMLHVSMSFDASDWARWAVNNGVDERGINFVLNYPEIVTGSRTTARSLTQFFDQIRDLPELDAEWDLVHALARSALDDAAASAFMAFVSDGLTDLITPNEILTTKSFGSVAKRISAIAQDDSGLRIDRLNAIAVRLFVHLTAPDYEPETLHGKNVVRFLLHESLPNDLRVVLHRDLVGEGRPELVEMLRSKELAELSLAGM